MIEIQSQRQLGADVQVPAVAPAGEHRRAAVPAMLGRKGLT
jgi:hypothetical protein